jgi:hypothetical protein
MRKYQLIDVKDLSHITEAIAFRKEENLSPILKQLLQKL